MDNKLVRYSRAGDAFHYRWAARRCLRLLDLQSPLTSITIEGSRDPDAEGECVIDLAEYSEGDDRKSVAYFQLKHTTVRAHKPFGFDELEATFAGFAKRYLSHTRSSKRKPRRSASFSLVTNRQISQTIKETVSAVAKGEKASLIAQDRLEQATGLRSQHLKRFCSELNLIDGECDYLVQKQRVKGTLSGYIAGFVNSSEVDAIIALVTDRALPQSDDGRKDGSICREDVLRRLGATSERDLFPAPAELEKLAHVIQREQHQELLKTIITATEPVIIHAAGGVGKSVVARQLLRSLPKGCFGAVYDCFGGGKYRNPSEPRHRACDALVQLANDLATRGLCTTLISHAGIAADAIFRAFLDRLNQAVRCIRQASPNGLLFIFVDAADNAEVAARDRGEQCFASELLRESPPSGCRLVMFCRTERVSLLGPRSSNKQYELKPFSISETTEHLRQDYPSASARDASEFHRLTGGNPRVQSNALAFGSNVEKMLEQLGPHQATTVADQIEKQLQNAISVIKQRQVNDSQIDAICLGLANLPPFIPLTVLSRAASVDVSAVRSFISDLGRPLWLTDDSVQFRDEPTETWFRQVFSATNAQLDALLSRLEPLAKEYRYVAKVLPELMLKRGHYDRLVELALSEELLPENNALDQREIRLFRLQFAFKAALRTKNYGDAIRLAFRAGEEAAGNDRQASLVQGNLHLIAPLLGNDRVQDLAYRRVLRGAWDGSENIYSAALLSSVKDFHGEARSYLKASDRWLRIYFDERSKQQKAEKAHRQIGGDQLQDLDLVEMGFAILNLSGAPQAVKWLTNWTPPEVIFRITRLLIRRLVDLARFPEIYAIAEAGSGFVYLMLAVADELLAIGMLLPRKLLSPSVTKLTKPKTRIQKASPLDHEDHVTPAILSLLESAAAAKVPKHTIKKILDFYIPAVADWSIGSNRTGESRRTFLRSVALQAVLDGQNSVDAKQFLAPERAKGKKAGSKTLDPEDRRDIEQCIAVLAPWHLLRTGVLISRNSPRPSEIEDAATSTDSSLRSRYRTYDPLPADIEFIRFELLSLSSKPRAVDVRHFIEHLKSAKSFRLTDRLLAARTANRRKELKELRSPIEISCQELINPLGNEDPEERARWFALLAAAVLPTSIPDAAAYFNAASEAISKYGTELVERWEAVVAVAKRASGGEPASKELAYRFIRCGEKVGENVAREKYWDRDGVFQVAVHVHAPSAFAGLSRWSDRKVGQFNEQLRALAHEAVEAGFLPSRVAWSLSGFEGCNGSGEHAFICISREPQKDIQQQILDQAVRDLMLDGITHRDLERLEHAATSAHLSKAALNQAIKANELESGDITAHSSLPPIGKVRKDRKRRFSTACFIGVDITAAGGLATALKRLRETEPPIEFETFWLHAVNRVPRGREVDFLRALTAGGELDYYDVREAIRRVRSTWISTASVKREWPQFLKKVGVHFASSLANRYRLRHFADEVCTDPAELSVIMDGVLEGLSQTSELLDASTFFGFIEIAVDRLGTNQPRELLDYALGRFEIHFEPDFSDGPWASWLYPTSTVIEGVMGMIWSSLGSPYSSIRWQAAHCVRRLAEYRCDEEISLLISTYQTETAGPFASHKFPFYHLHAKLYLLIALFRVAVEDPSLLRSHSDFFSKVALGDIPHALIQRLAAATALVIEKTHAGSYPSDTLSKLRSIGVSQFPLTTDVDYSYQAITPWHRTGAVDLNLDLYLGYDFDHYWLRSLGSVFGVSEKAVTELVQDFAVRVLKIPGDERHSRDPRQEQWNQLYRYSKAYSTDFSHGSYPQVDTFGFYYSYHAMLCVASQLISEMPVVSGKHDFDDDRWRSWLKRHELIRCDGRWLSDRRDPTPSKGSSSRQEPQLWIGNTQDYDFVEALFPFNSQRDWVCVSGHWNRLDGTREEDIYVESALVARQMVRAVSGALYGAKEQYWSGLPSWDEDGHHDRSERDIVSDNAQAWIRKGSSDDRRIDSFDPYARRIMYPARQIADPFAKLLNLSSDVEGREWRLPDRLTPSVKCHVWSDHRDADTDERRHAGERILASIEVVKQLCRKTGLQLVFEVRLRRRLDRRYSSASENASLSENLVLRIFSMSSDGILKDLRRLRPAR